MENQYEWIAVAAMAWSVLGMAGVVLTLMRKTYTMAVESDEMNQVHQAYLEHNKEALAQLRTS